MAEIVDYIISGFGTGLLSSPHFGLLTIYYPLVNNKITEMRDEQRLGQFPLSAEYSLSAAL